MSKKPKACGLRVRGYLSLGPSGEQSPSWFKAVIPGSVAEAEAWRWGWRYVADYFLVSLSRDEHDTLMDRGGLAIPMRTCYPGDGSFEVVACDVESGLPVLRGSRGQRFPSKQRQRELASVHSARVREFEEARLAEWNNPQSD